MKSSKLLFLAIALLAVLFTAAPSSASTFKTCWVDRPVEKLGRGIINVGFSPFEMLIQPYDVAAQRGNLAGISYGVLRGVCYVVARIVVGAVDIVTFLIPLPGCPDYPADTGWGYGPIMRPEWVFDLDHNWGDFFFNDDAMVQEQ